MITQKIQTRKTQQAINQSHINRKTRIHAQPRHCSFCAKIAFRANQSPRPRTYNQKTQKFKSMQTTLQKRRITSARSSLSQSFFRIPSLVTSHQCTSRKSPSHPQSSALRLQKQIRRQQATHPVCTLSRQESHVTFKEKVSILDCYTTIVKSHSRIAPKYPISLHVAHRRQCDTL